MWKVRVWKHPTTIPVTCGVDVIDEKGRTICYINMKDKTIATAEMQARQIVDDHNKDDRYDEGFNDGLEQEQREA